MKTLKITIIANNPNSEAVKAISRSIQKRGHVSQVLDLDKIRIVVSNNPKGYDTIRYVQGNKSISLSRANLGDAIIPRIGTNVPYGIKVINHLTKNMGLYSCISSIGLLNSYDQMRTLQVASEHGIRTPKSYMSDNYRDYEYIASHLKLPIVIKHLHSSMGAGVSIIDTMISLKTTLQSFSKIKKSFLVQEFIYSGGNKSKDIRAVVIGNQVVAAYERTAKPNEIRANLSQGGSGRSISLSKEDKELCVKSAKALGLETCGIDLMKDQKGKTYLIESNSNYGWKIEKICGVDIASEIIKHIEQKIGTLGNRKTDLSESRKYVEQLLPDVIGKKIHFIDRANRKRSLTIRSVQDLESVMYDTFRINISN
jgi:ribosomal protein S6--L-glutamate ligase